MEKWRFSNIFKKKSKEENINILMSKKEGLESDIENLENIIKLLYLM